MNTPKDKDNFLIEVTPEVMDELNRLFMHVDEEPYVELHYSPYWKSNSGLDTAGEEKQ